MIQLTLSKVAFAYAYAIDFLDSFYCRRRSRYARNTDI